MIRITAKRDLRALRLFINDLLHLEIILDSYVGMQSWQEGTRKCVYKIEFYLNNGIEILCAYEDRAVWEQVLKLLEENL